ncbi:hypothetical protein BC830DRAFT_1099376 [Chytriomyces sp. MP71]|nr:hypothetical protein BC830DRAFT_1099376 [Chytriomyces sp. MP71]
MESSAQDPVATSQNESTGTYTVETTMEETTEAVEASVEVTVGLGPVASDEVPTEPPSEVPQEAEKAPSALAEESVDKDAVIAALRDEVASLKANVSALEARLAIADRANEAHAQPKLVHANKGRANPRKAKATLLADKESNDKDEDEKEESNDEDVTEHKENEPETPEQVEKSFKKKITTMGGVSMFGGAAPGFNPFAGASPTSIQLKARPSVTASASNAGTSEADAAEAVLKLDETRNWIATTLADESVKSADIAFGSELLKDGSILCRLVSTLFPNHAVKSKPGKFIFIHKENLGNYFKACSSAGVTETFDYEDLTDKERVGYVILQLQSLKQKAEQ